MIHRRTSNRIVKCRSCNKSIPANTESYFVAAVGNSNTNVFVCKECVLDLVLDISKDYGTFDDLGQHLTMRKLTHDRSPNK